MMTERIKGSLLILNSKTRIILYEPPLKCKVNVKEVINDGAILCDMVFRVLCTLKHYEVGILTN